MSKSGTKDEFSLSEVARELGISRQAVWQKVVYKCRNPYIKYKSHGRPQMKLPVAEVKSRLSVIVKHDYSCICPHCGHLNRLTKLPKPTRIKICRKCSKSFRLDLTKLDDESQT
jgi:hypothetical protein